MPSTTPQPTNVILTTDRWMLSQTGEIFVNLQHPLEILIDGKGTKIIAATGDIQLAALGYEPASEIELDLDIFTGIPVTVIGTQGTVKILD